MPSYCPASEAFSYEPALLTRVSSQSQSRYGARSNLYRRIGKVQDIVPPSALAADLKIGLADPRGGLPPPKGMLSSVSGNWHYVGSCLIDNFAGCDVVPWVTNLMKSDSARRDGWTSPPSPKNRQKLMMSGCQRVGST